MKVINVSKMPFEFTWDAMNFGPIMPGEVVEYPDDVGMHCIRKSVVLDDEGNVEAYRMESLSGMSAERIRQVATYPCPFAATGQCDAKPFVDIESLKAHLDVHFLGRPAKK